MSSEQFELVTERELPAFRRERLSPAALLELVERHVRVLLRLGIGVGKSHAIDDLLDYQDLYRRFDLVGYIAPMRAIVNERRIVAGRSDSPVRHRVFRPRPKEKCGPYAEEWASLERRGLAALGKAKLCSECQANRGEGQPACFWPRQFKEMQEVGLVFATEKYLGLNRSLVPFLKLITKRERVLVLLDEGSLLDASFEMDLCPEDLERLAVAIGASVGRRGLKRATADAWCSSIQALLDLPAGEIGDVAVNLPSSLFKHLAGVQSQGVNRFGPSYRCVAYALVQLRWSRPEERWMDANGAIRFIARPYLHCHVLILSAHLTAAYAGHRLGVGPLPSPFEQVRFQHSGTLVVNVQNRVGADRYFKRNQQQILDTFAVALLRNIIEGRSTLVICRKKRREFCADFLRHRLRGWGVEMQFVVGDFDRLPAAPDPRIIPVLHYGIRGVNDFEEYEAAYCLDSFYVNSRVLNRMVQEFEPETFRVELTIVHKAGQRVRRVELVHRTDPDLDRVWLGNIHLRKLEVDPVIQAAGRVRFLTRPREVVLFQMHDLAREIVGCREVGTLVQLRDALGLPTALEIDEQVEAARIRELVSQGITVEEAGARLGISRRTAFRRLKAGESAKSPLKESLRRFGTLPAGSAGKEAFS